MYRPALVIGLGGTGIIALRHMKSQLLASQAREMPPQVKLVALDTVKDKDQAQQTTGKTEIAALRTELDPGEYYWIGGNVYDFVSRVARDTTEFSHISSWFQSRTYLDSLPPAAFALENGAGQLRQFGRLAIFNDVSAPAKSNIYTLINKAIKDIRDAGFITTIDVFLVASVAGGTGAGMFVDVAYLTRQIARADHTLDIRLRGFLVLPEAFGTIPGGVKPSMRARAYACMRENKRFMIDFQYEHGYPMYYHASGQDQKWRSTIHNKLFDFIYHVDGQSQHNPLTTILPEYGVTAAIADAIVAILDKPQEGEEDVYDRHQTNVLTVSNLTSSSTSFDSAIGTYSLLLPMHQITEWMAHKLCLEALDILLSPKDKDSDGYNKSLLTDANAEYPARQGEQDAFRLLQAGEVQSLKTSERVSSTPFIAEIARVGLKFRGDDSEVVKELGSRGAREWDLAPPGGSTEIDVMRQRVQQELNSRVTDEVPPNQPGESAKEALERILRGVEEYKSHHLGREELRTGQLVGGHYRMGLQEYVQVQANRYRLLLHVECENILNGGINPDAPASVQRGGKPGYLISWLSGLESLLGRFLQAMNRSRALREEQGEKRYLVNATSAKQKQLEASPGGIFGGKRRKEYLEAVQAEFDMEKTLILEDLIRELVDTMLQDTKQLRENAENWANVLGVGYDSIYGRMLQGERRIRDAIRAEQEVPVRQYVWDENYLNMLYDKYTKELANGVDNYLENFNWMFETQRSGAKDLIGFRLYIKVSEETPQNRLGLENQERNMNLILSPARGVFAPAWDQESVLKYLKDTAYRNPDTLAELLARKSDVLLRAEGQSVVPANYLHVAYGNDPEERNYLDRVKLRLGNITQASGSLNEIVNSGDRFALRLVNTLDLIPLEGVDAYRRAEDDYWTHVEDYERGQGVRGNLGRETLHLFPAEVEAARLESRIPKRLNIGYRSLHNDVVLQLEDMNRFRLFVRAWAFSLIFRSRIEESGGRKNFWLLKLPAEETGSIRGPEKEIEIYLTHPAQGDPDIVGAMKIWNYQRNDVRSDIRVPIDYDRVNRSVGRARDEEVAKRVEKGEGIDDTAIADRVNQLTDGDRIHFTNLWIERRHRTELQENLMPVIRNDKAGELAQDAAIVKFMVLDEDIESLNIEMEDLL